MPDINKDIEFYEDIRKNLESEHMGKWVLIYEQKLIKIYNTFDEAAKEAVRQFGQGPYLIRQIGAPPIVLPVSLAYFQRNHA